MPNPLAGLSVPTKHRRPIALLLLGVLLLIPLALVLRDSPTDTGGPHKPPPRSEGVWFEQDMPGIWVADPRARSSIPDDTADRLESLGYLEGYTPAPQESGVTKYLSDQAIAGYNLIASGHASEAVLTDMRGALVHRWSFDYEDLPVEATEQAPRPFTQYDKQWKHHWRGVTLFENGDLLAIFDYLGLIKLAHDSDLIWFYPGLAHHELTLFEEQIYVLTSELRTTPLLGRDPPFVEDFICVLDQNGREVKRVSMFDLFQNSQPYLPALEQTLASLFDPLHTNGIDVFEAPVEGGVFGAAVQRGDLLVSMRQNSLLAVVDLEEERFKSVIGGPWRGQHTPRIQQDGTIMIFDNEGYGGYSRVLIFDPRAGKIAWSYEGDPPDRFYSQHCGYSQRLGESSVLVTESGGGRAFEVDMRTKDVVWEYYNPHRAGDHGELIALLLEVKRIPADFNVGWARYRTKPGDGG